MPVERSGKATQSAQDYLRVQLLAKGYPAAEVIIVDSFPYDQFKGKLTVNYIAAGFNFDDGGRAGEIGSDFTRRVYLMEFFVFGVDSTYGKTLADTIKALFEPQALVPLRDIGNTGELTGETMLVESSRSQHVPVRDPRPWEYFVYQVQVRMIDEYYASQP